jgi:nitrile hydratase beta subunit
MNGVHDLGGMHGFGPVTREEHEPVFHAPWEAAVMAVQRAVTRGGVASIDEFRHAVERMDPARYLGSTYYERWLDGLCRLLVEKGVVTAEALKARAAFFAEHPEAPVQASALAGSPAPPAAAVPADAGDAREPSFRREPERPRRFAAGAAVVTRNDHPRGHTRLPRYARGRRGVVVADYGTQVFPDASAGGREEAQPLYCVRFDARELWGPAASATEAIHLDLWESYLLPA